MDEAELTARFLEIAVAAHSAGFHKAADEAVRCAEIVSHPVVVPAEASDKTRCRGWINIYPSANAKGIYTSRAAADRAPYVSRVACIEIEWEE